MTLSVESPISASALGAALEALGLPVYTKDAGGRYSYANRAAELLFGRPGADGVVGRNDAELLTPPAAAALRAADQSALAQATPVLAEHSLELAGGVSNSASLRPTTPSAPGLPNSTSAARLT